MIRTIALMVAAATLLSGTASSAPQRNSPPMTADQLVAKVVDTWINTGFRIHATLTRTMSAGGVNVTRQVLITGRRDANGASVVYEQLWPASPGGRAVLIEDTTGHQPRGYIFERGTIARVTPATLTARLFESDLRLEDLTQSFWYWPSRRLSGEEAIGEYRCAIVDFRPPTPAASSHGRIRAWVSPDLAVALRLEFFGRDGRLTRRINLYRVVKVERQALPAIVAVEPADGRSRTVLEGAKLESDLGLPAADFAADAIKKRLRAAK